MIQNIMTNWSTLRVIRLGLGIVIIVEGVKAGMWIIVGFGVLFALMPILNTGCGTTGSCAMPQRNGGPIRMEDKINYDEVEATGDPDR